MTPFRSHGRGTLILKGRYAGVRIERASGTHDPKRLRDLKTMCRALAERGRLDVLQEIAAGRVRPLEVWNVVAEGDWSRLPTAETAKALDAHYTAWCATVPGARHRADCTSYAAQLAPAHATVGALPRIVSQLRETYAAKGAGRQFNKLRDAASAFLRQTLSRQHPLYLQVRSIPGLPVTRRFGRHPQAPDQAWLIAQQLGGEAGWLWWVMCCTGMGPKELWRDGWAAVDGELHVHGQKRAGRDRVIPLILAGIDAPAITAAAFQQTLKRRALGVTPYDGRRSFAVWCEQAGILPSHQDAYLGHGPRTMGDLYRQHTILADQLEGDRARLEAYVVGKVVGHFGGDATQVVMSRLGIEPRTYGLKVRCSTN